MSIITKSPTLAAAVRAAAERESATITYFNEGLCSSYADIRARSAVLAADLRRLGVAKGARLPIVLPTTPGFTYAFFGAISAGAQPCPISMPAGFGSVEGFARRLMATTRYLGATHILTTRELQRPIAQALPDVGVLAVEDLATEGGEMLEETITPDDVAFIQCTSGSTGSPKGVVLTHGNLVANAEQMSRALAMGDDDVLVSWLPLNHDMGLIGGVLLPLYAGIPTVLLSPGTFQRRPAAWLKAISRYRGTISPAPNFAYGYATARARHEELEGVDLSSWRHALCGAEPIDYRTLAAFQARFEKYGLPPNAVQPCYGMAEASLAVSFHATGRPLGYDRTRTHDLATGVAVEAAPEETDVTYVVNCGAPVEGTDVKIVDAQGATLPDGHVGRIQIRGPSITKGYFQLPDATASAIKDGWLDTGDLGYLRGGELRITGRAKDIIIIRGRKYRPAEFEWAAEQAEGVRPGTAVAFGVHSAEQGTELLYIVCEAGKATTTEAVQANVIAAVVERVGLRPDIVRVTYQKRAVPKTTSGKLQREKTKELVLANRPSTMWRIA